MRHDELQRIFADKNAAREYLEELRWSHGVICPHCGSKEATKLNSKPESKTRKGVYKCKACRKQFTVTVGTIFEDSHIPMNKWLHAIHMMCASKKGVSAHQLHRTLTITYKSAWFMVHRIRYAMTQSPLVEKMFGDVEVDETYVGGKPRKENNPNRDDKKVNKRGRGTNKTPVVLVLQRDGEARAKKMKRISAKNLREFIQENASKDATVNTDGFTGYTGLSKHFEAHEVVDHGGHEFARGSVHVNTAESWFALLKRGVYGTFHHVSDKHLDRYIDEFAFRWNNRKTNDMERAIATIKVVHGKRLMYKTLI